jgi:hypothetical protein
VWQHSKPIDNIPYSFLLFFIVIRFHWLEEFVTRDKIYKHV